MTVWMGIWISNLSIFNALLLLLIIAAIIPLITLLFYKFTEKDGTALIISHNEKSLGLCNRKLNLVDGTIKEVIA